jgi:hypothetical protein
VGSEPAPSASDEPHHADAKPEAGTLVNPLCEGMAPSIFETACEVTSAEWAATPAVEPKALAQEAKLAAGVTPPTVEFALVNKSSKPVLVPLRFDDRNPGKSLSVIAETIGAQGIYVLAPPRVSHSAADASAHLHSTRIKLLPGGRASTRLVVDFTPVERLDKRVGAGVDAGIDAGVPRALEGSFTLHIGQLLSPAEMGDPATLVLSNDLRK